MDARSPTPVRIALWGTFDVENYGDALFPKLARAELSRRLPTADIRSFAPFGSEHPTRFDDGEPAEPLGACTPDRVAGFAEEFDCVVVGPGEIIHTRDELLAPRYGVPTEELIRRAPSRFFIDGLGPELERECPVAWHAVGVPFDIPPEEAPRYRDALEARPYVTVRERVSRERLAAAGVDREIAVVPDPTVLLPRLFPRAVLMERLEHLRVTGRFPREGGALVVQGHASLVAAVAEVAGALSDVLDRHEGLSPVVAETGPCYGDGEFAEALVEELRRPAYRLGAAGIRDIAAAIGASSGFVGTSLHGNVTALAFGRPHVLLGVDGESKLEGFAALIGDPGRLARTPGEVPAAWQRAVAAGHRPDVVSALQARIDDHFDRLAVLAADAAGRRREHSGAVPADAGELEALRQRLETRERALKARGRLLAEQRWRFADRVQDVEAGARRTRQALESEIRRLEAERSRLEAEVAGKDRELRTLLETRTFRYTAGLRRMWAALRAAVRR